MTRAVLGRADAVRALAGVFRRRGFASASLSVIQQEAGIGRGSLYHFFPGGKSDMARAVLDEVALWFEERVFSPLRSAEDAAQAIEAMTREVSEYFTSRQRVCLFAAMTLGEEQDAFAEPVRQYFSDWVEALTTTLLAGGLARNDAADRALDAVATIQGGLILARAYEDDATLIGIIARAGRRLLAAPLD